MTVISISVLGDNVETARLVVYDFQGNEVQTLSCAELGMNLGYAFSSDSVVCFRNFTSRDLMPVCCVDKDELDEGKAGDSFTSARRIKQERIGGIL